MNCPLKHCQERIHEGQGLIYHLRKIHNMDHMDMIDLLFEILDEREEFPEAPLKDDEMRPLEGRYCKVQVPKEEAMERNNQCGAPLYETTSGIVCELGHGGAEVNES